MSKLTLDFIEDYDFKLFGICCHLKDYRIAYAINKQFSVDLVKENDLELFVKSEAKKFSFYEYENQEIGLEHYLIANRCNGKAMLIPEEVSCDYFFLLKGNYFELPDKEVIKKMNEIPQILTTYAIEIETLRSKKNLLF